MPRNALTHLDANGRPAMVDVSGKTATPREALATCRVRFPAEVARELKRNGLRSAKGGIVDTAIIAGTLAVKRTHELIPFCHPLPIDGCRLSVDWDGDATLRIARVIVIEPDRGAGFMNFAPRVMLNQADLPATGLIQPASRVRWRFVVAASDARAAATPPPFPSRPAARKTTRPTSGPATCTRAPWAS